MRLQGRVALITGAGSGIGRAMCLAFAAEGAAIFAADLDEDAAAESIELARPAGGAGAHFRADVSRAEDVQAMIRGCLERFGRISILCNNAGANVRVGFDEQRQLNVFDSDLTRIELMEFAPAEKPCCSDFTGPHPTE